METYHTHVEECLDQHLPWLHRGSLRCIARRLSRSHCAEVNALIVPSSPMFEVLRDCAITTPAEVIPTGIPGRARIPQLGAARDRADLG
ncbi:MAG: hypothetical protein LJE59_15125 [Chromatiaceae bacterium]|nr:hypothetical protein [Chromatiaceae bacterium]